MPTAKARYTGDIPKSKEVPFEVKQTIIEFYLENKSDENKPDISHFVNTSEEFAENIISILQDATDDICAMELDINKSEIETEANQILKALLNTQKKLSSISLDLENLLEIDSNHLESLDSIKTLIPFFEQAILKTKNLPIKAKPSDRKRKILEEMVYRILCIFEDFDIPFSSIGNSYDLNYSESIRFMKDLGDSIGIDYSLDTWKTYHCVSGKELIQRKKIQENEKCSKHP